MPGTIPRPAPFQMSCCMMFAFPKTDPFTRRCAPVLLALFAFFAAPAIAADLSQPTGRVVLTVDGAIGVTNAPGAAQFDLAMLESLGTVVVETSTLWTRGVIRFEGVPLRALLDRLDIRTGQIQAIAANDYGVAIPVSDAVDGGPIIAFRRDGREMTVRGNGPLWIIYPYDSNPDYQTEAIYARSIWQLVRMTAKP